MLSRGPWKGNKYWICWRSSLESHLCDYCGALILWRGAASSYFFLFFHVSWFASTLGVRKHGSPQMLISMWHLRVNLYNLFSCSERNSKTGSKKRRGLSPFLLVFPQGPSLSENRPRTCLQTQKRAVASPILNWMRRRRIMRIFVFNLVFSSCAIQDSSLSFSLPSY